MLQAQLSSIQEENASLKLAHTAVATKAAALPKLNLWNIWKYRNEIIEIIELIITLFKNSKSKND